MRRWPTVNIRYPLKDFLADLEEIERIMRGNVIDFPRPINILDDRTGEVFKLRFSTRTPNYIMSTLLFNKYGEKVGSSRALRFWAVIDFLKKWKSLLITEGLVLDEPDKEYTSIRNDFVRCLLTAKVNEKTQVVPKKVLHSYLAKRKRPKR